MTKQPKKRLVTTHPLYHTYTLMKNRCYNDSAHNYKYYGARGIYVCDRWLNSFWDFVEDVGKRPYGHQLDRVDNNGPYHPDNIKWSTRSQQQRNTQRTSWLTSKDGTRKSAIEWAEIAQANVGIGEACFRSRIYSGWSVDDAISQPIGTRLKRKAA